MPSPFDNFMQSQQAQAPASSFDDYMKSQTPVTTPQPNYDPFIEKRMGTSTIPQEFIDKVQEKSRDFLRPTSTMGGAAAGGELGAAIGNVPGAIGGSIIGGVLANLLTQRAQEAAPEILGKPGSGLGTALWETGTQEAGGALAKPAINLGGNIIKGLGGNLSEALAPYFNKFPTLFKGPAAKVGVDEYADKMGGLLPEQQYATLQNTASKGPINPYYLDTAQKALKDPQEAINFISNYPAGRNILAQQAYKKAFTDTVDFSKTGEPIFSPGKVLQELNTDPVYPIAIPSQQLSNTRYLMQQLVNADSKKSFLQYNLSAGRLGLGLGLAAEALSGKHLSSFGVAIAGAEAGAVTLYGIEKSIGMVMKNPSTARAMIEAARTPITAPSSTMTGKIILNALKGTTGYMLQDNKGNMVSASIDDKGKVVPDIASLTQGTQQ